ncbi:MAG: DnaJ C-terminal domain-containing protein [Asticcacaulis sp.]
MKRDASDAEIQKAFRKLAKELHPDQNKNNKASEERFKRITAAYDFLKDADKRKKFDAGQIDATVARSIAASAGGGRQQGSPFGAGAGASAQFEGLDIDDIMDMFGGGRRGGGFGGQPGAAQKGSDLKIKLDIDLLDTIVGNTRRVLFSDGRTVDVNIPKGSKDGQVLRLKGQGAASPSGRGPHGDALVELRLKAHPIFRADGNDLHMDLFVSLPDAVLGGKVQAPTPDGPVSVNPGQGVEFRRRAAAEGPGCVRRQGRRAGRPVRARRDCVARPAGGHAGRPAWGTDDAGGTLARSRRIHTDDAGAAEVGFSPFRHLLRKCHLPRERGRKAVAVVILRNKLEDMSAECWAWSRRGGIAAEAGGLKSKSPLPHLIRRRLRVGLFVRSPIKMEGYERKKEKRKLSLLR